jgi:hypothetical protein
MRSLVSGAVGKAWLFLVTATGLSWWLGVSHGHGVGNIAVAGFLVIAFIKAWVVGRWFMELRTAPAGLRRCFDAWVLVTGTTVAAMALVN